LPTLTEKSSGPIRARPSFSAGKTTEIAATATAQDRPFARIMLGLNRFQEINDSLGHD